MSKKLIKKVIAVATSLTVVAMLAPAVPAQALTAEEIQQQIAALQAQLAQLQAQLASVGGTSGTTAGNCNFTRNLYPGVKGADVKCLQQYLNSTAYKVASAGAGSPGHETEYYGTLTKKAVASWQAANGITAGQWAGYFGPASRAKYNELVSAGGTPGTPGGPTVPVTGQGLTVSLAADNSAATNIVADSSSGDGAQALIPFLKVVFANSDSAEVKVTKIEFTRSGISADSDISQAYLYDGDTQIAEYSSFRDSVLTFNNAAGLFKVPAGSSKTITLKCDLANGTGSGKTIKFSIASASAIASDASSVNGTYPLAGNYMTTATASDLGKLTVATTTGPVATIDPQEGAEVMNFTLAASSQNIEVRYLKFTNIGSTDVSDIKNFKLYDGGTQVGNTVASMDADKSVVFNLSDSPLVINKGVTKTMHLRADIVGGANRTFSFTIQKMTDVVAYDKQYGVYIKPNQSDSWTILYAYYVGSTNYTTINTGKMTLSRASDSPSGNIALDATNVTLAKFDLKAYGEDVKISSLVVRIYGTVGSNGIYQGYVALDGSQQGTATSGMGTASSDSEAAATTFSFGNTFIVPADGKTHSLEIKGDVKKTDGTSYSGGETLTVKIHSVTATGRSSSQTVSVSSATGYPLTITSGTLSVSRNYSQTDWSATYPTGIAGQTNVLVGSFVVSAGASEGANITAVRLQYTTTTNNQLQNLRVYKGTLASGTQIGNTQSTVTASTDYTFYPSPYISLEKNEQFIMNVYADLLTSAPTNSQGYITVSEVDGTGKVTNSSVNYTSDVIGQTIWLVNSGTLGINVDTASNPNPTILVMNDKEVVLGKWKFSASTSAEDIKVTKIVTTTTLGGGAPTSSLVNLKLYDGATQIGNTVASLAVDASVTFDLSSNPWVIPMRSEKILTMKADVSEYPNAISNSSTTMTIRNVTYKGAASGEETVDTTARAANLMNIYNSKPLVTFVGPTSGSLVGGTQTLIEFKVKAAEHAALSIYRFNFKFSLTDGATTTDLYLSNISLYDKSDLSTVLNDRVASSTSSGDYQTGTRANATIGRYDESNSLTAEVGVYKTDDAVMDEIGAGDEVTYVLKGTVNSIGAINEDEVQVELTDWTYITGVATSTAVVWGDGYTAPISAQYVKTLPAGPAVLTK